MYAPHRHVDLSYLHFVTSLYCYNPDTETLTDYEISASWDTDKAERRHELSHKDVLETFTLEVDDELLWEHEVRPFFRAWIGQLSVHARRQRTSSVYIGSLTRTVTVGTGRKQNTILM